MTNVVRLVAPIFLLASGLAHGSQCTAPRASLPTIAAGSVLVFGEVHGTKESPDYFLRAVCAAVEKYPRKPLLIGLEFPTIEQSGLDQFINSDGDAKSVQALLLQPFWNRSMQDGRSSRAMFELIDGLRLLRKRAPNMTIAAFVDESLAATHDASMAARIDNVMAEHEGARVLILIGNYHAKRRPHDTTEQQPRSMVDFLQAPNRSLAFRARSGTYFACVPLCGSQEVEVNADAADVTNWSADEPAESVNFDGMIDLGKISESIPAITAAQHAPQPTPQS